MAEPSLRAYPRPAGRRGHAPGGRPLMPAAESASVGDGGVAEALAGSAEAGPGDEHRAAGRADGHRGGLVPAVAWPVVTADPPRGAVRGVVGDRGEVIARAGPGEAGAGDVHRAPARADGHRVGEV